MAAALSSSQHGSPFSAQDIQNEMRKFLHGATKINQISNPNLCRSALFLLRTLPAARHAVLEHFSNVFDDAVNSHISKLRTEKSGEGYHGGTDDRLLILDGVLQDIIGVLLSFVKTNPEAWAPIISNWSLELLGHISCKYAQHRIVAQVRSLNEMLQLWMTCKPTKLLMEVATECFAAMVGGAPDSCVDCLLEASVKYSPHFDWVVAHIGPVNRSIVLKEFKLGNIESVDGSCFPTTIINRVLMCGLKDFSAHSNSSTHEAVNGEEKIPKMASVVGILGHLASTHGQDIRKALMSLFEESLLCDKANINVTTVPFLLELASMSPMLLQVLTTDLIKALTPDVLNNLHEQFEKLKHMSQKDYDWRSDFSLINLVVHLVTRTDVGALEVLTFLMSVASRESLSGKQDYQKVLPPVQEICGIIMNHLLYELQKIVYMKKRGAKPDIPLLIALNKNTSDLCVMLLQCSGHGDENCAADVLTYVISTASSGKQLEKFLSLQQGLETAMVNIMKSTMQKIVDLLHPQKEVNRYKLLQNLCQLIRWEKEAMRFRIPARAAILTSIQAHFPLISLQLSHPDIKVVMATMKIFTEIDLPNIIDNTTLMNVCSLFVEVFFNLLHLKDRRYKLRGIRLCRLCIKQLCQKVYCRSTLLLYFVRAALSQEHGYLFSSKQEIVNVKENRSVSLFEENTKHGTALTLLRSHSSVFHAGIIGHGLKSADKVEYVSKDSLLCNKRCFLDILYLCCTHKTPVEDNTEAKMDTDSSNSNTSNTKKYILPEAAKVVSDVLLDLITPDVLYNQIPWPDEDCVKVTVERDILIWKKFDDHPFLWDLFNTLSESCMVMCLCSSILRSLIASLIIHFDTCRDKSSKNSPKQLDAACRAVECLRKSHLLPEPLCFCGEIFPHCSFYEVYCLLQSIWKFIKANPPCSEKQVLKNRVCDAQSVELFRSVLHNKIDILGHIYGRYFSLNDAKDS